MKNTKKIVISKNIDKLYITLHNGYNCEKDFWLITKKYIITLLIADIDFNGTFGIIQAKVIKRTPKNEKRIQNKIIPEALDIYNSYDEIHEGYIELIEKVRMNKHKIILNKLIRKDNHKKQIIDQTKQNTKEIIEDTYDIPF